MRAFCNYCGKKITKTPKQIQNSKNGVYCDRECFHKWYRDYYMKKKYEEFVRNNNKGQKKVVKSRYKKVRTCEICGEKIKQYRLVPRPDMEKWVWMCWSCIEKYCEEQVMKPHEKGMCVICKVKPAMNQGTKYECTCCRDCFFATAIID
jgi:hypothetical protein